jgi:hypothetical protein
MVLKLTGTLLCTTLSVIGFFAHPAHGLPKTLGYSFYIQGAPAGRTDIRITEGAKELVFESETRVVTGPDVIALTARTVADPRTFEIRDFSYKGTKGSHAVACQAQVKGSEVFGFVEMDGALRDKSLKMRFPRNVLFEDWLMEHEILLALTQASAAKKTETYGMVFTSSFSPADVTMGYSGEVLVEAGAKSMTARKLVVIIRGAEPFESHVDPARGVPVYIRFPTSQAEAFLDEVFGENPVTFYSAKRN